MRRRSLKPPAPKVTFPGVPDKITTLEQSVFNATYSLDVCLQDFLTWMFPARTVQTLTDAFSLAYRRAFNSIAIHSAIQYDPGCFATFRVNGEVGRMCTPAPGTARIDDTHPKHAHIVRVLAEIERLHMNFNKVRTVANWMEAHATPGAARYYWPAMCMLLPPEHPINHADGSRYREPAENIAPMIPLIRETPAVLVSAKLAEDVPTREYSTIDAAVLVQIEAKDEGVSQMFRLL